MNKELLEKYYPNLIKYYEEGDCCSRILELRKEIDILHNINKQLVLEIERLNNTLKDIKEYFNKRKEEYSNCKSKNNINYIHYGQLLCDLQRIIDKN